MNNQKTPLRSLIESSVSRGIFGVFGASDNSSTNCLGGYLSDYGERLRQAKRDWEREHDPAKLPWTEVARKCAVILGRRVHAETARLWAAGKQEPTLTEFRALAEVLETDVAELAFGTTDRGSTRAGDGGAAGQKGA